jgi:hypothetical protein
LLLRNPADYKGGFWLTYVVDRVIYKASSNESSTISVASHKSEKGKLQVVLDHSPIEGESPLARLDIRVWSYNKPIMLVRYSITNPSTRMVEDMKLYSIMDFDVGGPMSYKDDTGSFDLKSGLIYAFDKSPLCVAMTSRPRPDGWEISPPTKLRIDEGYRDLSKNLKLGPLDIATALQWNLGNLNPGQSREVDVVLSAEKSLDQVKVLMPKAWELFGKKIR